MMTTTMTTTTLAISHLHYDHHYTSLSPVVMLTTSVTATSGMLPVLPDPSVTNLLMTKVFV